MSSKACVGESIFVGTIKLRFAGKRCQPGKRGIHLLRHALEQSSATHREQGVTNKGDTIIIKNQSDVAESVAGHFDNATDMTAQVHRVTLFQTDISTGNILDCRARKCARRWIV